MHVSKVQWHVASGVERDVAVYRGDLQVQGRPVVYRDVQAVPEQHQRCRAVIQSSPVEYLVGKELRRGGMVCIARELG